ncbi:MAG: tetratricopeptide repeat protein [Planctomycetes bacterium]|nr:tetratricopeptide repeat protein [Planctomycetota bacterium]
MTTTTKNQGPSTSAIPQRQGFQPIPTRIRDPRDTQVPPLVVEPMNEQDRTAIRQSLGELSTKLAEIHRTTAEAYLSQTLYEEALPHIEAAATFAPGEAEYQMQLGFVRYVTGDDAGAINAFNAALALDGRNAEGWFNLGMVLFGQSHFAEAEDCFRRAGEIVPDDAQTWNNRGVCLWRLQRIGDAKACFQNALQLDPADQDAAFNLQALTR